MRYRFEALSGRIIEAALEVHTVLGPGFVEAVYENALDIALTARAIPFERQKPVDVWFRGIVVGRHRIDLVVAQEIVVELKATATLGPIYFAQVRSYLNAAGLPTGLLLNFNSTSLVIRRVIRRRTA
ncbi:MAG: GxxExxY protein [Gemmatimonadota bacterium]